MYALMFGMCVIALLAVFVRTPRDFLVVLVTAVIVVLLGVIGSSEADAKPLIREKDPAAVFEKHRRWILDRADKANDMAKRDFGFGPKDVCRRSRNCA